MQITYTLGVKTPAGWRSVTVTARVEMVSPAMCVVREVQELDGETPGYGMSRTGAKRQEYDGRYYARTEVGKKKRISACTVVE